MLFDISSIKEEIGARLCRDEEINIPWEEEATRVRLLLPWHVHAELVHTQKGFVLSGTAQGEYEASCDRCLSLFKGRLKTDFSERFSPRRQAGENEEDCVVFEKDLIDASGTIAESIILQLPMKRLCSPDCLGLCPKCGKNLNYGSCGCVQNETDPRWSKLELWPETEGGGQNGQPQK